MIFAPRGLYRSISILGNTTAIQSVFKRISAQFQPMYHRKAFLNFYMGEGMGEGMDLMEFDKAKGNVADLIAE